MIDMISSAYCRVVLSFFFFSSRRRHTRCSRDWSSDVCSSDLALCHSGEGTPRAPPFSYRPGEKLDDYLIPPPDRDVPTPDVHGNQVGLLRRSKCYRSSPGMS